MVTKTQTLARIGLAVLCVGGVISTLVWAGPLNPPGGPVSSTYKTLSEVEPRIAINATNTPGDANSLYKITQPGSYYLTGNITGVVGKHGIEIVASGVTLDLNGFDLSGVASMGSFDGVSVTVSGLSNIAVVNGSVRNWGQCGINLGILFASNCQVDAVSATGNVVAGISAGNNALITRCAASNNQNGIAVESNSVISDCSANSNSMRGILANSGTTITHCSCSGNISYGIVTQPACTISACTSYQNVAQGIYVVSNGQIIDCNVINNSFDGILCGPGSIVRGNTCDGNGFGSGDGANIHAMGADSRIEANNCVGGDRGIDVDSAGNIIIKNTCSGNTTNWDVVAGNTILVVQGSSAGAVLGNTGGTAPGSTDPNANFTY
ncbi:MAG: right-handed parallel beta-helix repeat-containing protein [Phycisphaerales bacterium]